MTTTRWTSGKPGLLACLLLVGGAHGADMPARIVLGHDAFKAAPSGPAQQFKPPAAPAPPLKPLVDPEIDGLVGLVSFEQLRDIIARTEAPEDRRMLQRAFDKLLLLERDRRVYAQSVHLLIEGCGRIIERKRD